MENGSDDDDDEEDEAEGSLARALADLELVASAYPDEVQLPGNLQRWMHREDSENGPTQNVKDDNVVQFPIRFTLYFDPISFVLLEITAGYPSRGAGLRVVSFRNNSSENKARMESAVSAIRLASLECLEEGVEAGLMCCSAGLDRWNEGADGAASGTLCDTVDDTSNSDECPEGSDALCWVSGDPVVEKKSVFQAHVCRISTEVQAQSALRKLIGGSSKLQRATHNMWAYRVRERMVNPATGAESMILKHDNDDDGEDAAGGRLAMLLDVRGEDGVMVVVSRWYGGVKLGPRRFAIIANVARELLDCVTTERSK